MAEEKETTHSMKNENKQNRKIRVLAVGTGSTGNDVISHILNKGIELVGCADADPDKAGRDIGDLIGIGAMGVTICQDLDVLLEETKADIAIVSTLTRMTDIYDTLKSCIVHGVNVITSSEECYHYRRTHPELGEELDKMAKEYGVTVLGTGIQDVFYSSLSAILAAACHNVQQIKGVNYAILDYFGVVSNRKNGVGMTLEEFEKANSEKTDHPNAFTIALHNIAERLGLMVNKETETRLPLISRRNEDIYCPAYKAVIPAGHLIGTRYHTELETDEGITLTADFYEKLAEEGETGICKWSIVGDPCLELSMPDMRGERTTASALVARIPDVLNARPGFLTVADLEYPRYYVRPLNEYVKPDKLGE